MAESRKPQSPAKTSAADKRARKAETARREAEIDEALDGSFPASDPPSYSTPHRTEGPQADGSQDNDALGSGKRNGKP